MEISGCSSAEGAGGSDGWLSPPDDGSATGSVMGSWVWRRFGMEASCGCSGVLQMGLTGVARLWTLDRTAGSWLDQWAIDAGQRRMGKMGGRRRFGC
ncbi:hypothetical protein ACLOJK_041172 [Asimina triloba]